MKENFYENKYQRKEIQIEPAPCLFLVDLQVGAFLDYDDAASVQSIAHITKLLSRFRELELPIAHFWLDENLFFQRNQFRRALVNPYRGPTDFYPLFQPQDGELVIQKPDRSCFFGTDAIALLHRHHINTIILAGTTTSGCIRTTASHADMIGYTTIIPEECVFDVNREVHENNLFDIRHKYAAVWSLERVLQELEQYRTQNDQTNTLLDC